HVVRHDGHAALPALRRDTRHPLCLPDDGGLLSLPQGTEVEVRAPVYKIHGEDYEYLFEQIRVNGYRRARIDGKPRDLGEHIELDEDQEHTVEAVIDTFVIGPGIDQQVVTSLEHGLKLGDGLLGFHIVKPKQP